MSRVADLAEPLRVAFIDRGGEDWAVHYICCPGDAALCGHDPVGSVTRVHEGEDEAPDWVHTELVCWRCREVARDPLRWWHPRAKLPGWAVNR